jgi:uncharacterized membrane protein YdjX (TVP38/TMEM64 family)
MLWVAIGQAPGLFLYAYMGTLGQLGLNVLRGRSHPHAIEFWLWIGGFVIALAALFFLGRIALRVLREGEESQYRSECEAYSEKQVSKLVSQGA